MIAKYSYQGPYTMAEMKQKFIAGTGNPKNYLYALIIGQSHYTDTHNYVYARYGVTSEGKANKKDFKGIIICQAYSSEFIQCSETGEKEVNVKICEDKGDCIAGVLRIDKIDNNTKITVRDNVPMIGEVPIANYPGTFYDSNRFHVNDALKKENGTAEFQIINLGHKRVSSWEQIHKFTKIWCPPTWGQVEEKQLTWGDLEKYDSWHAFSLTGEPDPKYA